MKYALLLAVSMAASLIGNTLKKHLSDRYDSDAASRHLYNAVTSAVAAVMLICMGGMPRASLFTILLGLLFGLVTALQQIASLRAIEMGPFSYTSVISSLSTLIPTLSGVVIWHETIAPIQFGGIGLMCGCFVLAVHFSGEEKKASLRWLGFCAVLFLCTGFIGVMQKWHQSTAYREELDAFLVIAFGFSFLFSGVSWLIFRRREGAASSGNTLLGWLPMVLMAVGGVCAALNNKLNLYLSGVMDSAVFFPLVNGGGLILTTLAAVIFFRERLRSRQWLGILCGIAAVVCLCLG